MKKLFLFAFIFLISQITCLFSQDTVKTKICYKQCIINNYSYKFGKIDVKSKQKEILSKYDNKGNEIEKIFYKKGGSVDRKCITKYSDKGTEYENTQYKKDGSIEAKESFKDDAKGRRIESVYNKSGSFYRKIIYKFDDNGIPIEEISYKTDGSLEGKTFHKYNDNGKNIEDVNYNPDGSLDGKTTYKYDYKDSIIEILSIWTDGSGGHSTTYKYDNKGNITEKEFYDGDAYYEKKTFKYDDKDNIIEEVIYNEDGSVRSKENYKNKYDVNGNLIQTIGSSLENDIENIIFNHKYDEKRNLIGKLSYKKGGFVDVMQTFKNDKNGGQIPDGITKYNLDGSVAWHFIYKYNEKGNEIEGVSYNWSDFAFQGKHIIKYDDSGNIIEELKFNSFGEPESKKEYVYVK